jgi:NitT/TauT family transport system permease protein
MDVAGQFSVLFILSMVGLLLNSLVAFARRRVLFWDASQKSSGSDRSGAKRNEAAPASGRQESALSTS